MRRSIAALALIRREDREGRTLWLVQWNRKWNAYAFIGGHKRLEETFRECVIREMTEELHLIPDEHFTVNSKPLTHLEYAAWSRSAREETQYTIELFEVELTDCARRKVDAEPINRWLSEAEVREKRCSDGRPVSETIPLIFNKVGLPPTSKDDPSLDHFSS